jgi:hypothetical protein
LGSLFPIYGKSKKIHGSKPLSNYKWPFSIAMVVYQRVNPIVHPFNPKKFK